MWVVDTCIILDVFEDDPDFGVASAKLLQKLLPDGLMVSPVTMVELAPAFEGDLAEQKYFLSQAGIAHGEPWSPADIEASHQAWNAYIVARRRNRAVLPKRPLADLLIGGFALNRQGLITRNPADFRTWFPKLTIRHP